MRGAGMYQPEVAMILMGYCPAPDPLSSKEAVSDAVAAKALGMFFEAVLKTDGPNELRRIFSAFWMQAHGEAPPDPTCWADNSPDGLLKADPGVRAATNGL